MHEVEQISPEEVAEMNPDNYLLVDVRSPMEYHDVHATNAMNYPLDQLSTWSELPKEFLSGKQIVCICKSGARSQMACQVLQNLNCTNVMNTIGGTMAWVEAGLPVNRGA